MAPRLERAFSSMKKHAEKMRFERTGLVPTCAEDYLSLKTWYQETGEEYKQKKMQQNVWDLEIARKQNRELARVFGGRTIGDGNVGILGLPTIWTRNWSPTEAHPLAPWPSPREFREEGDERYTSNYGRYLPIPRLPGNPTVVYKQKSWNPVEPLDRVMPVPKLYGDVNINMLGYFDATVDEEGVPYDDEGLPGKEYFVEQNNRTGRSNSDVHSIWDSDTKVSLGDHTTNSYVTDTPTHKPRPSRFRAEAVPFVARQMEKEDFEILNNYSKKYMNDNLNPNGKALKASTGTLFESTNLAPQLKTRLQPASFGYVGMEKINHALENDPYIDTYLGESHGSNSIAAMPNNNLANFIASKNMFDLSPRTAYSTLKLFQSGSKLSNQNPNRDSNNMETSSRKIASKSSPKSQDQIRNTISPMGFATPPEFHTPNSFSSKYRANKPASLQLDKMCMNEFVISARMDSSSTDGGVKLDAAANHA